jgi:hypothetical protein
MASPISFEGLRDQMHTAVSSARAEGGTEPSTPTPSPSPGGEPPAPAPVAPPTPPAAPAEPAPVAPGQAPAAPPAPAPTAPLAPAAAPATAPPSTPAVPVTPQPSPADELARRVAELEARVSPPQPTGDEIYLPVRQDGSLDETRLELMASEYRGQDPECSRLREEYKAGYHDVQTSTARLGEIAGQVRQLESVLNPDSFKSLGLTVELDELQRSEARAKLMDLRNERYDLDAKVRDAREYMGNLERQYDAQIDRFKNFVVGKVESRQETAATEYQVEAAAQSFERDAPTIFENAFADAKIPPAYKNNIWQNVKARMKIEEYERGGAALETDLRGFMVGALQAEVANLDAYHRAQSAVYADRKVTDAVPMGTILNPAAAGVPPPPGVRPGQSGQNWEASLRSNLKATRQNVRAAYGGR